MILSAIVATCPRGGIGIDNDLPWHLPSDLKRFKTKTLGMPIIMGKNTFESIGRPLPGRHNIVVSSSLTNIEGITIVSSIESAVEQIKGEDKAYLIGGSMLYSYALETKMIDEIDLTVVNTSVVCNKFFFFREDDFMCMEHTTTIEDGYIIDRYLYRQTVNIL